MDFDPVADDPVSDHLAVEAVEVDSEK